MVSILDLADRGADFRGILLSWIKAQNFKSPRHVHWMKLRKMKGQDLDEW